MLRKRSTQKTKNCIFWLVKYKVFDLCDFLALLLKFLICVTSWHCSTPLFPLPADCHVCKWLDQP